MADTSPRPRLRPGPTKTGRMTVRNRPVWQNPLTKEIYSEKTVTIPWGDGYTTVPSVDGQGNELSREELFPRIVNARDQLGKGGPVDFITGEDLPVFDTEEDAVKYAMWRSNTMFDKEASAQGFQTEQYELEPEKEDPSFLYDTGSYIKNMAVALGALGLRKLGFNAYPTKNSFSEGGISMLPAVDDDRTPSRPRDTFNPLAFAKESWESAKENFRDAGVTEVDLDDPTLYNGYIRAVDYLKDSGLAGLDLIDAAAKAVIGTAGELVTGSDASQKRFQRDIYSMPEAFAGAAGARSVTQLDDALEAGAESAKLAKAASGPLAADAVGQTRALLQGDREFLSGTPTDRATTQSLSAGFTGQNPPAYIPKDELVFDPDGIYKTKEGILKFREPIAEFTRKLTMTNSFPNKGMTGAEFLRLLEKNAESIPPSSYKEGLVDKDKRYTREELLDAVTKSPAGLPESIYYNLADLEASPNFRGYQRQTQVGFTGYPRYPEDTSYFSIPILSRTSGNTFKANSQHFDASTTAHVRGSFIDPLVGFEVNKTLSPEFKSIVGKDRPYLLVEEIQSDLLQKGYRKPKNSFDFAFDRATSETMAGSPVTFQEAYGDITNELKSLVKSLESKGVAMPEEPVRLQLPYKTGVLNHPQFKDRRRRDFIDELYSPERGTVEDVRLVEFEEIKDYIDKQGVNSSHIHQVLNDIKDGANRTRSINDFESVAFVGPNNKAYDDIIVRSKDPLSENPMYVIDTESAAYGEFLKDFDEYTKKFGLNYDDLADAYDEELDKYYDVIDKEITDRKLDKDEVDGAFVNGLYERFLEIKKDQKLLGDETNTALPPVRKNRQTVEEALKLLIAKADQEGVDKIVIPPASKIAEARGRTIDPSDKGDRFYRTYVADLNKALEDLEKNYPVTVHRDVDLPYKTENQPTRTAAQQHLIDMGFEDMVNDNPNAVAANAADDAAINDDDLFIVEEGNQFFELPEGFFDDVPDQDAPVQQPKTKAKPVDYKGTIIDISKLREQFQVDKPRQFAEGGSIRPKLRPEGFANATSPKPRLRPSEDEVRYVDAVFRGEDGDIITSPEENNPVTMLGLTDGDTFRQYPNNLNIYGAYLKPSDTAEGGPHKSKLQELYAREKPDSPPLLINDILIAGEEGVKNRYTAAHEFMHRGFNVLRNNHNFDEVSKRFGRATAQILFHSEKDDYLEHALVQSILEKEGKIAGIDYTSKDYLKGVSKETRDKLKKSVEDIYELSNETLGEAGYQTDRDRGPTTRQGRRGAKPKSFWSFITEKLGFAEGGTVDMNQQMSFAFEDGGLRDDGMMRDPVSGNEVPPGSTAKEVRDDIPAQLSEGEYVVPADVVRYYGVKFFEDLRDNAKMGLQDMEARGRIGGEPVPAGGPMDGDLSPEELAAIQEMMGMAEGGVVNMYKQQQDLYSAPKQAVGNPTTNMNQGGTVAGYQPGGSVATDQNFLQAGQQAQQRSFAGFPLGATIFPSAQTGQTVLGPEGTQVATTDAIGGGTTGGTATDDSALVTVTLYGPNGEIRTLTLPTDQATYDQLIAQGWSTEMPIAGATSDNDDGGDTEVETDPNAWMNKFSYDDFGQLATQTSETLTKIPFGGAIGLLGNGTKAAQAAANIIVMKANGYDTAELEEELTKFRKETGLNLLPNELTNGDQLAKDIMLKNTMLASSDATDLKGKPLFTDDQDFRDYMSKVLPETVSSPGLSGATAESATEVAKEVEVMSQPVKPVIKPSSNNDDNDVPSHAEIMEKHYGTSWKDNRTSTQKEASDVGFGSDTGGWTPSGFDFNKGGLMEAPKQKKRGRPKKSGLAGKK